MGLDLKPQITETIRKLELFKEYRFKKRIKSKLTTISSATIDRILSATKKGYQLKGKSTTKPGTLLRGTIQVVPLIGKMKTRNLVFLKQI